MSSRTYLKINNNNVYVNSKGTSCVCGGCGKVIACAVGHVPEKCDVCNTEFAKVKRLI